MDVRFNNPFHSEQEEHEISPENSADSPPSSLLSDTKATSTSSPKRRRTLQKRVVSVPIRDVEGSRLKGETNAPPSDSWAWRKYGQKPIKGSPYPRGYYRCSSSKGCPARKQVERSRADPTMVVVTYSCEHNHPWPATRNNNQNHNHHSAANCAATSTATETASPTNVNVMSANQDTISNSEQHDDQPLAFTRTPKPEPHENFPNIEYSSGHMIATDQYGWFSDWESTTSTLLESPLLAGDTIGDADMAMIFSIGKEDESFFADLGELPECTAVFRRRVMEREEEHRRCNLAHWCGTTG